MRLKRTAVLSAVALVVGICTLAPSPPSAGPPSVLLLTLDTTRADALGAFGGKGAHTPVLDALAARGVRFTLAITSTPLTLPAHTSLLTGLAPPEHGVQVNGMDVLPKNVATLAEAYAARGYATAAFVATFILDHRFGLARGFERYDDRVPRESTAERPFFERSAREMTDTVLAWLPRRPAGKPLFLWVHYYDPHEPYRPPGVDPKASDALRYAGEVTYMDREIGRLLAALPGGAERWLIAAVGDHGQSFGAHGETNHGIFLYQPTVHVPLLLAGPGVPRGQAVAEAVATRRLASTLLHLSGTSAGTGPVALAFGPALPGLPGLGSGAPRPVYLVSRYPMTGYGWSPLEGMFDGRFKLIVAPRPELYDLAADPGELRNVLNGEREPARRLQAALAATRRSFKVHPADAADPELARALQSLGYLSGSAPQDQGTLDPKDGVPMLAELAAARNLAEQKSWKPAIAKLTELVRRCPRSIAFLNSLAEVQLDSGQGDAAIVTYRQILRVNPKRDESHRLLADTYARRNRGEEARLEYELALELNPRSGRPGRESAPPCRGQFGVDPRGGGGDGERVALRAPGEDRGRNRRRHGRRAPFRGSTTTEGRAPMRDERGR